MLQSALVTTGRILPDLHKKVEVSCYEGKQSFVIIFLE